MYRYAIVVEKNPQYPVVYHVESSVKIPTGRYGEDSYLNPWILKIFDYFQIDYCFDEHTNKYFLDEHCYVCVSEFDEFKFIPNL